LACGTSWWLYLHRYLFALIKPQLVDEWHLNKEQLGLLDSAFATSYTLFQFPLGIAADTAGVRLVLTGLMLLWCGGLALHAWAPTFKLLAVARALLGAGQSAVYAALNRVAQNWFPPAIRTTLQGLVGVLAGRIGGLSANLIFGSLLLGVLALNWRTAVYLLAAGGAVHAILFAIQFRNSPRQHPQVNAAEAALIEGPESASPPATPSPRLSPSELLHALQPRALANLSFLCLQTVLSTFADNIYSNWIPLFLTEVHHLNFQKMGVFSALPLLGGAIGGVLGGALNDLCIAWTGSRRWSRSGVGAVGKTLAAIVLLAGLLCYDRPYVFCGLLFVVKLLGDWSVTTTWGVVTDIGGRATASVFGFNNAVASLGAIAAPLAFGFLAQHYGWPTVFIVVAATYVLCALSWLFIDCTIPMIEQHPSGTSRGENHESHE